MKTALCSSCRRSERTEPAAFAVTGLLNGRPYRAHLCSEHLSDLEMNLGFEIRRCRKIEPAQDASHLETIYRRLCATIALDAAGLAQLDAARTRWWSALFSQSSCRS